MSNNRLRIPFNHPVELGGEPEAIARAFRSGQTSGMGPLGAMCEELLESWFGGRTLLVSSCTHALEMAALLLDLQPGDEVILPAFTFVSTANAFVLRGARPVFVDVDASGNLDVDGRRRAANPPDARGVRGALRGELLRPRRARGGAARAAAGGGRGPGDRRDLPRPSAGHAGRRRRDQLPRDQERRLRRGRGAGAARVRTSSSGPSSSARRGPIGASSARGWSTSTPGSTSARRTCSPS